MKQRQFDSPEFEEKFLYFGNDLGAVYRRKETVFTLWSPLAEKAEVCLYRTGCDLEEGACLLNRVAMNPEPRGIWRCHLPGDWNRVFYTYRVTVDGRTDETADPYAKAAGSNGMRSMVVDLRETDPEGWQEDNYRFDEAATRAALWEVHVRDFSFSEDSGMTLKGKYPALGEIGTTVGGDGIHPTGVDYLKQLGITHVHLLPVHCNGSVDDIQQPQGFNWGYDPLLYNVPEGSFSTDPLHGEVPIRELKQGILGLHRQGIGVVLDVVFNHTYLTECSCFQRVMPDYYYRKTEEGEFADASGCGNETASERAMMRLFILDSVRYLAEEYHVDGFRFDLMGVHDTDTMNEVSALLRALGRQNGKNYLLYGEPWAAQPPLLRKGFYPADMAHLAMLDPEIAVFNDRTRDAVKGSAFHKEEKGFVTGLPGSEEAVADAFCGYRREGLLPTRTVSYVSSHDNYSLWDKLTFTTDTDGSGFDAPEMLRIAVSKLAAALILCSQGIPFFQGGEEMGRTKKGDGNSFRSGADINNITWGRSVVFGELVSYYRGLLEIRKHFSPLTDPSGEGAASIRTLALEPGLAAFGIPGKRPGEPREMVFVFNASEQVRPVDVSGCGWNGAWRVLADEQRAGWQEQRWLSEGEIPTVFLRSALILASEETLP